VGDAIKVSFAESVNHLRSAMHGHCTPRDKWDSERERILHRNMGVCNREAFGVGDS